MYKMSRKRIFNLSVRYTLCACIGMWLGPIGLNAQQTKRVLFLGNSYTAANNLPSLVSQMAISTGDQLLYDSRTPGGYRMMNHAADPTTLNKIASSAWDYVTLQGQSQETSLGAAFLHADVHPFAKALCDSIRSAHPCAEPLFYMTWGRENGDASNCSTSPWVCTYERMDSAIHYSYQELTDSNRCSLAPVGHVWRQFRRKWPGIGLYTSDGSHPNARGSYVAACTFYTLIFKKDPTAISFDHSLSPQIADSIRMLTKAYVYDSLALWERSDQNADAAFQYSVNGLQVQFTADRPAQDSLFWDLGDGTTATGSQPTHSYANAGSFTVRLRAYNCSDTVSSTQTVSIASQASAQVQANKFITLYPNPARDELMIKSNSAVLDVELWSAMGRKRRLTQAADRWLLPNVSAGSYLLKVKLVEDVKWRKIQIH